MQENGLHLGECRLEAKVPPGIEEELNNIDRKKHQQAG